MASDLFCCERLQPELRRAEKDPVIFLDSRVLPNLLSMEKLYIPKCDYFSDVQFDIKPYMRKVVATWMLELCEELGLEDQVFPVAVNYLDRFLCSCSIDKKHLQLAASVCIMLASKIRQCQYVNVETLCFYTDHSITSQQIKNWEVMVLSKLRWNVAAVTGFDYIDHIIDRVPWGKENPLVRRHAVALVGICYADPDFMYLAPSTIATASLCSAARGLKIPSSGTVLTSICQLLDIQDPEEIEPVIKRIEAVLEAETTIVPEEASVSKTGNYSSTPSTSAANKQDAIAGHPETPTDVQDIYF